MAVKMNLRIITKNYAADSEIGFLAKSFSKSNGFATAMPTPWELRENHKLAILSAPSTTSLLLINSTPQFHTALFNLIFQFNL